MAMAVFSSTEVNAFAGWLAFTSRSILGVTFCTLAAVCSDMRPLAGANTSGFSAVNSSGPMTMARGGRGTYLEVTREQLFVEVDATSWTTRG
jgi:hypothetical protein